MIGKLMKNVRSGVGKAAKPAPRVVSKPKMPTGGGAGFGAGPAKMPPRFKPNMPMVPDLSKRPPVVYSRPTLAGGSGAAASVGKSMMKSPMGALKYMVGTPTKSTMKKGGAVKKAAAKGKK